MVSGSMNAVSEIIKSTQLARTCDGWSMWGIEYTFTSLHSDDGRHLISWRLNYLELPHELALFQGQASSALDSFLLRQVTPSTLSQRLLGPQCPFPIPILILPGTSSPQTVRAPYPNGDVAYINLVQRHDKTVDIAYPLTR